ncbi:Uncharacterized protein APZ42_003830 [Daphnia magna]|uniref:Uncharacterized protein n=1 Tax=Daphnia magna TaxID=35525 RepID=A0A164HEK2_9CRUS|nr:Uncharacterized protein APZ42_003830 [Daphnia magna]
MQKPFERGSNPAPDSPLARKEQISIVSSQFRQPTLATHKSYTANGKTAEKSARRPCTRKGVEGPRR